MKWLNAIGSWFTSELAGIVHHAVFYASAAGLILAAVILVIVIRQNRHRIGPSWRTARAQVKAHSTTARAYLAPRINYSLRWIAVMDDKYSRRAKRKLKAWRAKRASASNAKDKKMVTKGQTSEGSKKPEFVNVPLYLAVCAIYVALTGYLAYHFYQDNFVLYNAKDDWRGPYIAWLLFTLLSVGLTKKSERPAIWILNTPAFEWPAWLGVYFAPFLISSVTAIPRTVFERELPDDQDWVFYGDDKEPLPERIDPETGKLRQMTRPVRITTGGEMPAEKYAAIRPEGGSVDDAGPGEDLNYLMTVAQNVVLRYRIKRAFDFLIRAKGKNVEDKLVYTEKEMADFVVKVLRREYTKHPIGGVLILHPDIEAQALAELSEEVEGWGIELEQTVIKPPDLTHDLNTALAGKPIAAANAKAAAMRGIGTGQEEGNRLKGIAEGEKAAAASLEMTPAEIRRLDKATEMVKDNTKYVLGVHGIVETTGLAGALEKALAPKQKEPTT